MKKYNSFNKNKDKFIDFLLKTYDTWDNYSISIMYLNIISSISDEKTSKKSSFISLFIKLLLKGVHFNPGKRTDLMKLDEFLLIEMYNAPNIYGDDKDKTEKYINGFIDFLKDVNNKHYDIKKSIRESEEEIIEVSKSIKRPI